MAVFDYLNRLGIPIIFIFIIVFVFSIVIEKKSNQKTKVKELKEDAPNEVNGIVFGKKKKKLIYSPSEAEGSVGVFSASGTGKTAAIGIPTLRSWSGTSFVIDISGDICKNCSEIKNKLIFDPENPDTIPYNIFGMIDNLPKKEDRHEALEQLAYLLMPEMPGMNDNARFFLINGRKILTASLIAFYDSDMDFIPICEKIIKHSWQTLFRDIDATKNTDAILYINSFEGASEVNTAGCKQSCDDAVKLFATNAKIKNAIHRPKEYREAIEPRKIEEHSIFLIIEDPKLNLYAPLINIITSQMMQYISNRIVSQHSHNILLFLDEYASLHIDAITVLEALRKYRKRKCRIMILTQNLADLDILYGRDITRAILANLRFKVLLGGLGEPDSQTYFSNLIGFKDIKKKSTSRNAKSITTTISTEKEYIISPADLDRQGRDTVILICPDEPGFFLLKKNYYFKQ